MEDFVFENPTKIFFGKGIISKFGTEVSQRARRILLLMGKRSSKTSGAYQQVVDSLMEKKIHFVEFNGIKPNPSYKSVKEAIQVCRKENLDAVVAIGGGSTIDTAKAVAAGVKFQGELWDCFGKNPRFKIVEALPIYCVLTISASGSEMNSTSVITNDENQSKLSLYSNALYPVASFLDPDFQKSLPPLQTIYGAIDIVCHVMEVYFNGVSHTEMQDYLAEGIMKIIFENTRILLDDPNNYESRAQFVWAGTLALNGLNSAGRGLGDWSTHRIGHALSAMFDLPHGLTLAIVLPAWLRYCYKDDVNKFARFGREVYKLIGNNQKIASEAIFLFHKWILGLGISTSLVDQGIRIDEISNIAKNPSIPYPLGVLRKLDLNDVENILHLTNY